MRLVYMRCFQWSCVKSHCGLCKKPWDEVARFSHGLFYCEKLLPRRRRSYDQFGLGAQFNVQVEYEQWVGCINQMASNPLSIQAGGKLHLVRLAYLATVLSYYKNRNGHSSFHANAGHSRRDFESEHRRRWLEALNEYKCSRRK